MFKGTLSCGKMFINDINIFGAFENKLFINKGSKCIEVETPFSVGNLAINKERGLVAVGQFSLEPINQPSILPLLKVKSNGDIEEQTNISIDNTTCSIQWFNDHLLLILFFDRLTIFNVLSNKSISYELSKNDAIDLKVHKDRIFILFCDGYVEIYHLNSSNLNLTILQNISSTEDVINELEIALEIENHPYLCTSMDVSNNFICKGDNNGYIFIYPFNKNFEVGEGRVIFLSLESILCIKSIPNTNTFIITDNNGVIYLEEALSTNLAPTILKQNNFSILDVDIIPIKNEYKVLYTTNNEFYRDNLSMNKLFS
jgi:hypothetical protein